MQYRHEQKMQACFDKIFHILFIILKKSYNFATFLKSKFGFYELFKLSSLLQ
jgi:hypothetical protein